MKIIIDANIKEIAGLVSVLQSRQEMLDLLDMAIRKATDEKENDIIIKSSVNMRPMNAGIKISDIDGHFYVSRNGIKINGEIFIFDKLYEFIGTQVNIKSGKVFGPRWEPIGMLRHM
ncbi:MAG: hypothetical protein EOM54_11275 [Clostridia bacterium]|nr:hypothetical protein [Clostridia bacterium]